ncbi:MAG: iron-siderophore ABC transporter substrate-binding protein [Chloroflexota bacterium]
MKHRIHFITTLLLLALLAACVPIDPSNLASDDVATEATTAPAEEAAMPDGECGAGFRLFDHAHLANDPVCIPESPQRVAILGIPILEFALIEDIKPVAVSGFGRDLIARSNPDISLDMGVLTENSVDVDGAAEIGGGGVNLEALLATNPDLIIAEDWVVLEYDAGLELFNQIAPTILYADDDDYADEQRGSIAFMAAAMNMPEAGEVLLAQLDTRIEAFRDAMGDDLETTTISIVRIRENINIFLEGTFSHMLVTEVGLSRPEHQQNLPGDFAMSEEMIPLVDADHLFVFTAGMAQQEDEAKKIIDNLKEDPLWQTLDAVQNDRLYSVGSNWMGFGLLEAHSVLDDLFENVAGVDPAEVSPNPFE